ncbi:hypothetical protein JD844_023592 [Phrynosoma platyrhinos]|uniref:Uncharacterized protein n=1 Tax=Phrynosoma platyrhinos TaxID=52577 RepID=A0ABQ7SWT0_PHRPL|nr:hypothetical protein JD844_023592 [Phrynosoma platyrhinos]
MLSPFWSSQLRLCAQSMPFCRICGEKLAVIITQNRLIEQHLGMFNREVKSADIEQLLSPIAEPEVMMEMTPVCRDNRMDKLEKEQVYDAAIHKSTVFPLSNVDALKRIWVEGIVEAAEAESQPLVTPSVLKFSPQATETGTFQSNIASSSLALNDKENVPLAPLAARVEAAKDKSLVEELAQDLQRLLDLKIKCIGSNLISETHQTVISVLREQKRTLPDLSALALLKKSPAVFLCLSTKPDVWRLRGMDPVPVHSLHPSQELCSSQLLNPGLRNVEGAPTESQTSFDVLKSIWSPKLPRKGTKLPVPRPLAYPHLAHRLLSSRALNLEPGQPKEFLQLYSIIPE